LHPGLLGADVSLGRTTSDGANGLHSTPYVSPSLRALVLPKATWAHAKWWCGGLGRRQHSVHRQIALEGFIKTLAGVPGSSPQQAVSVRAGASTDARRDSYARPLAQRAPPEGPWRALNVPPLAKPAPQELLRRAPQPGRRREGPRATRITPSPRRFAPGPALSPPLPPGPFAHRAIQ
jgi:hypothetical protein